MKFFLVLFYVLISLCQVQAQSTRSEKILRKFYDSPKEILIAAHRGGHRHVPENSLPAIDEAIKAGADIAEIDIRETKDGIMVLSHDKTLDRATTGSGLVKDYTLSELNQFTLKHLDHSTPYHIPTFREALAYAKDKIMLDIDFKIDGMEARQRAYSIIAELGMEKQVLFFIYDYTELEQLKKLNPAITVMPRAYKEEHLFAILKLNLTPIIHIDPSFENSSAVKEATKKGIRLWMNTLGDVDKAGSFDSYHQFLQRFNMANVIQTDYPEKLRESLKKLP